MPKVTPANNIIDSATDKVTEQQDFKTAYTTLKNNAQALQASQEPDIDALMDVVSESIAAYKVCQTRILAVQQALDEAFSEA